MNTKQIFDIVDSHTKKHIKNKELDLIGVDAKDISEIVFLERSHVSRILNRLFKTGELCKTSGRPTKFFSKLALQSAFPNSYIPATIPKNSSISFFVSIKKRDTDTNESSELSLIGANKNESLHPVISSIDLFLSFPSTNDLLLVYGPLGCGKSHIYKYISSKLHNDNIPFSSDPGNNGIIIIDDYNDYESFRKLSVDYNSSITNSKYILFSSNHDIYNLAKSYQYKTTVIIPINERTLKERTEFVFSFFDQEAKILRKTIRYNESILICFIASYFFTNIHQLKSSISTTIFNAFLNRKTQTNEIEIVFEDIPTEILDELIPNEHEISELRSIFSVFGVKDFTSYSNASSHYFSLLHSVPVNNRGLLDNSDDTNNFSIFEFIRFQISSDSYNYVHLMDSDYTKLRDYIISLNLIENPSILNPLCYTLTYEIQNLKPFVLPLKENYISIVDTNYADYVYKLSDYIKDTFNYTLQPYQLNYIDIYITTAKLYNPLNKPVIIFLFSSQAIAKNYLSLLSLIQNNLPIYVSHCSLNSIIEHDNDSIMELTSEISSLDQGKGTLIVSDRRIPTKTTVKINNDSKTSIRFISYISYDILTQTISEIINENISIHDLNLFDLSYPKFDYDANNKYSILEELANSVLSKSLNFLDAKKLTDTLYHIYQEIIDSLNYTSNNSLIIKFILHTSFAIERVFIKKTLPYKKVELFIKNNTEVFTTVKSKLSTLEQLYNITITDSEIAYISEIFID